MAQLQINTLGGESIVHDLIDGVNTIGRLSDNAIVLDHVTVSGHHAEIVLEDGKCIVRDLNSSNGTKVNGETISEANLHDADSITFDGVECVFRDEPPMVEAQPIQGQSFTFGSKLASFGKAAYQETKRKAQLSSLKTQIEKLKLLDLNKAYYAIGRKAYELKIDGKRFGTEYSEIAETEKTIATKREGVLTSDGATSIEKVKRLAISATMKAEAEHLEHSLKQRFIKLGRDIIDGGAPVELTSEVNALRSVETQIAKLEKEFDAVSADHEAQNQLKTLSASLTSEACTKSREAWKLGGQLLQRHRAAKLSISIAVLMIGFILVFAVSKSGHVRSDSNESNESSESALSYQADQDAAQERIRQAVEEAMQAENRRTNSNPTYGGGTSQSSGIDSDWHYTRCMTCSGQGTIRTPSGYTSTCPTCGGTGKIRASGPWGQPLQKY